MKNQDECRVAHFTGALTIRNAEEIHAKFLDLLGGSGDVVIDVTDVAEVDVSFIQLLLAARRSAREQGRGLALAAPAAGVLREALVRGGFVVADAAFWGKGGDTP